MKKLMLIGTLIAIIIFISGCVQEQPPSQPTQICGNNIIEGSEQCDGTALASCQYGCTAKCTCAPQTIQTCSDGTLYNQCSPTKPKICSNGVLVNNCISCGCPIDQSCNQTTSICYTPMAIQTCSDGTLYGECSKLKPKFCNNGNLIDDCTKCGCFIGYSCQTDSSCAIISFFDGDPVAQSIINGGTYQLSENNYFTNGKVNTLSFEYKLNTALRQLGFNIYTLHSDPPGESRATVVLHRFQKSHNLPISNVLNEETFTLINSELIEREKLDKALAESYPPFAKFIPAPTNEPPAQHLAALYAAFLTVMPAGVKDISSFWTVEEFGNSLISGLGGNLGKMMDTSGNVLDPAAAIRVMQSKDDFRFCGDSYYDKFRELLGGSCTSPPTSIILSSGGDMSYMETFVHEFSHNIGRDKQVQLSDGTTDRADVQFGKISFYASGLIRPSNNDGEFVSGYAKTNSAEDFAESFLAYVLAGKIFREQAKSNQYLQQKYNFLKDNIFYGVEYDTGSMESFNLWNSKNIRIPFHPTAYVLEDPDFVWDYKYLIV